MRELYYKRLLVLDLPPRQSAFLWGARKTGKSTYLKANFEQSIYYDLLKSDLYLQLYKEPATFREEILSFDKARLQQPIIVDEIQKIPILLDEVHWLIENASASFILCGSSARKLKQSGVNLLGGRAWGYHFYPLVYPEITDFELMRVLNSGTIPTHYLSTDPKRSIQAYIDDYLTQEIKAEGLIRNLPAFAKFLDSVGFTNGEMVNYSNIARDCSVDAKTVKEYYQILIDTLLGYYIFPYRKKIKRDIISSIPKFYLFDVGIASALAKKKATTLQDPFVGKMFEQFILLELLAYKGLYNLDFEITYWRTKTGLEVDFIIDGKMAIEIKSSTNIKKQDLKGVIAFAEEHNIRDLYVVSLISRARKIQCNNVEILVLPYQEFLQRLWEQKIM